MIRILSLLPLLANSVFGWELSTPSHSYLWKSAQVVIVSEKYEVSKSEDQSNLPNYKDLEYKRIEVIFEVSGVLKGDISHSKESITVKTYDRNRIGDTADWGMFVVPPKGFQELPPGSVFYLFMRWDAYGNLVPIDEQYYSVIAFREYQN